MPDLLVKLYELPDAEGPRAALGERGITIRRAMPYEKHLVSSFVARAFGEGWASEAEVSFANHPVSCFLATREGAILGFACYETTCRNFFGPTGVLEAHRGAGVGAALLLASLQAMQALGYAYAIVGGADSTGFYERVAGATEIPGSDPGIYRDRLPSNP
ncbi:MAG: GNAT family N-acetyltransferase [Acidobacteriota bacterium]